MIGAAMAIRKVGLAKGLLPIAGALVLFPVVLLGAAGAALTGAPGSPASASGTPLGWGADIPPGMAVLYRNAADRFRIPLPLLEAVGKKETDHCRDPRAMSPNSAGAVGCMQFLQPTFDRWSWASGSTTPSALDAGDSVFAAAAKLAADGLAVDPWLALRLYNGSDTYPPGVLAWAVVYGWRSGDRALLGRAVLGDPSIRIRPEDVGDLMADRVDPRVLSDLLALGTRHRLAGVGPFTRHSYFVSGTTRVSNHVFGRAVDIGTVDDNLVRPDNGAARQFVVDALGLPDGLRPDEVLSPWAINDGSASSTTNAEHQDHVHLGFSAGAGS